MKDHLCVKCGAYLSDTSRSICNLCLSQELQSIALMALNALSPPSEMKQQNQNSPFITPASKPVPQQSPFQMSEPKVTSEIEKQSIGAQQTSKSPLADAVSTQQSISSVSSSPFSSSVSNIEDVEAPVAPTSSSGFAVPSVDLDSILSTDNIASTRILSDDLPDDD